MTVIVIYHIINIVITVARIIFKIMRHLRNTIVNNNRNTTNNKNNDNDNNNNMNNTRGVLTANT